MGFVVQVVLAAIALALPTLMLRGIYALAGWWGVGAVLVALALLSLFVAGAGRREREAR